MIQMKNCKSTNQNYHRLGNPGINILNPEEQAHHSECKPKIKSSADHKTAIHRAQGPAIGARATFLSRGEPLMDQSPPSNLINESQNSDSGLTQRHESEAGLI